MGAAMFGASKRRGAVRVTTRSEERLAVLARVPQLSECSRRELEQIDAMATEVRCKPGTVLHLANHSVRQVVVVLEGDVLESNHGIAATRGAGHLVGEEALRHPGSLAVTSVAAASPVRALVLGLGELVDVVRLPGVRTRMAGRPAALAPQPSGRRAWARSAPTLA
jgi:hypothetical protein